MNTPVAVEASAPCAGTDYDHPSIVQLKQAFASLANAHAQPY